MEIVLWLVCGVTTIIAAVLASRSRRWRYIGRAAVGVLFYLFDFIDGHNTLLVRYEAFNCRQRPQKSAIAYLPATNAMMISAGEI